MVFNKCDLLNTFSVVRSKAFLFALLAISSLVISSLSPLVASAATSYDPYVRTTDEVHLKYGSCEQVDVTTTYESYLNDLEKGSLNIAKANGTWGVSQNLNNPPRNDGIAIYWSLTTSDLNFVGADIGSEQILLENTSDIFVYFINMNSSCEITVSNTTTNSFGGVTTFTDYSSFGWLNLFLAGANINYPDGYEGLPIETEPVTEEEVIRPDFSYTIVDKSLNVKDINNSLPEFVPDEGYTFKGWEVEWSLFYCAGGWSDIGSTCETELELKDYDILPRESNYLTDVDIYGDYRLSAQYVAQQCYRYPSYPETPDYCFYVVGGEDEASLDGYRFPPTTVDLKFDGGTYSGDTRDTECDESGYCVPPSPYKDCSIYAGEAPYGIGGGAFPDIIGGFQCQLENFGTFLIITIQNLFVPNSGKVMNSVNNFGSFISDKLGFVYTAFQYIVTWINSILVVSSDCTISMGSATFFGATPNADICYFEENAGNVWDIGIFTARMIFAAGLIFLAYRRLFNILTGLGK